MMAGSAAMLVRDRTMYDHRPQMSGLAAVFDRDGGPLDTDVIDRMLAAAAHRGIERHVWTAGGVALAAIRRRAHDRPLATHGTQALVFDGRLDNRAELRGSLSFCEHERDLSSDAALALAAYDVWGGGGFSRLLGDFAVVLWDGRRRRLVCARDIVGVRPLFYYCDNRIWACGSELPQVMAAVSLGLDPNEGMVAEHLCLRVTHPAETLHRKIFRVPAAHVASVEVAALQIQRYYEPSPDLEIRYRRDAEYGEHFRSVLAEAIRARLDGDEPCAAYLSGGLDSSAVVSLAASLRERGAVTGEPLQVLSMMAPDTPADESRYIRDVVRQWNLPAHEFVTATEDAGIFADQVRRYQDLPEPAGVAAFGAIARHARALNCGAALTGLGGDDWLCAYGSHLPELLTRGRLREFFDVLRWENELEFRTTLLKPFLMRGIWPLLPGAAQVAINCARGRGRRPVPAPHLTPAFARATAAADRIATVHASACGTRTRQEFQDWFSSGTLSATLEIEDRRHAWAGVEARHPFHDRRVIEFLLAIPEAQRWRSTQTKFVLRQALGPLLPPSVASRTTKGEGTHHVIHALDACGGESCFTSLETARRGWVQEDLVLERYRRMRAKFERGDPGFATDTLRLWTVYGLEVWLRHAGS